MVNHQKYMFECLKIAQNGLGKVAPNPLVGCVIVSGNKIIGRGWHQQYGQDHAEVVAINTVNDKEQLKNATLYVNLEPCAHFGKTPPCTDYIIKHQIPYVVIGSIDINPTVKGKGIEKLIKAGIDVKTGVLEKECNTLNKRFFTFHEKKRPYIILKWAQTEDGFIDKNRTADEKPLAITNDESKKLSHLWRSQEQAIMIGSNTALMDNPLLTTRLAEGKNPIRILIDNRLRVPQSWSIFKSDANTIVFNSIKSEQKDNIEWIKIDFDNNSLKKIVHELYCRNIQSVIIEGGGKLLQSFINTSAWDEARVFTNNIKIKTGVTAPILTTKIHQTINYGDDTLNYYYNT